MKVTMHLRNRLGIPLEIELGESENHMEVLRTLGRHGVTGFTLQPNPVVLPYSAHENFDWSLIGARKVSFGNIVGVEFDGYFYTQRMYDEVNKGSKKLPKAIKYSRGSRSGDGEEIIEKSGDFEYICLIMFRGGREDHTFDIPAPKTTNIKTPTSQRQAQAAD